MLLDYSSSGEVCTSCDPSYDRQSSVQTQSTSASQFAVRYASTASTDGGTLCNSRTETLSSEYTVSFTVTAPVAYYLDVTTSLVGELDVDYDGGLVGGSADITGVSGSFTGGTLISGGLSLDDPGSCSVGGSSATSCHLPFSQGPVSARISGTSNGLPITHVLHFTWTSSAHTNACSGHEAAARVGVQSRDTSNGASLYPGDNSRTMTGDGHFVTVALTSLCGNNVIDPGEQCDAGVLDGTAGSCCSSACQILAASVTCRAAAGPCDLPETCTGTSRTSSADLKSTDVCRPAAGACDVPESCDGSHDTCPADPRFPTCVRSNIATFEVVKPSLRSTAAAKPL